MTTPPHSDQACCTSCRLVQPAGAACSGCGRSALVTLDRRTARMFLAAPPPPPGLRLKILTLLAPAVLGIVYMLVVLSYLLAVHDVAAIPWGELTSSVLLVGAPALGCLVLFHLLTRRRSRPGPGHPRRARRAARQGWRTLRGAAAGLDGSVPSHLGGAPCLVSCLALTTRAGAALLRSCRATAFVLQAVDGRGTLVEGEVWCEPPLTAASGARVGEAPALLAGLGLDAADAAAAGAAGMRVHAITIGVGDLVEVHARGEPAPRGHPRTARVYRDGEQLPVLRGEPGTPLRLVRS